LRNLAHELIEIGPQRLSDAEREDLRWNLSTLTVELKHASPDDLPSLSAQCHVKLGEALLSIGNRWRCERKALARAVRTAEPEFARKLDTALSRSCEGDRREMLEVADLVLKKIGGLKRTYCDVYE
jgi:hypothetical protein